MDYGKSGTPKTGNSATGLTRQKGAPQKPQGKDARGGKASREELLARMKAAAQAKKDG